MNRQITEGNSMLMLDASCFVAVVADLFEKHLQTRAFEEPELLNDWQISGLARGLRLTAHKLAERGEFLAELAEETEEEERAQAARQRHQGQDNRRESNVEGKCGTPRSA